MLMIDEPWMISFDAQLKWKNVEWHAQTSQSKKMVWHSQVLWQSCTSCSSAKMDLDLTIPCQLVWQCALLQGKLTPALHC
jgi:hypothetical protein